jgi:hypothetical protein
MGFRKSYIFITAKTKRILVAKMGKEAIHLGHGQLHMGISGVEEVGENVMVILLMNNSIQEHFGGRLL